VSQSISNVAESFTSAVTRNQDDPYTVDNLLPEEMGIYRVYLLSSVLSPADKKGLSLPAGADEKLLSAAGELVSALNGVYREKGHDETIELRASIAKNTACLSQPSSGDRDHIDRQVGSASHLQMTLRMLELGDPVACGLVPKLRRFVEVFAETKGVSKYARLALERKIFDPEVVANIEYGKISMRPIQNPPKYTVTL